MKMKALPTLLAFAVLSLPLTSNAEDAPAVEGVEKKIGVTVAIPPYHFIVKAVGGDLVDITTLVDAGQDPHSFNLTPNQTIKLAESDIFFTSGMPFEEQFIFEISAEAPDLKILFINEGLELLESACLHDHHAHEEEVEGEGAEGEEDGHDHHHDHHHDHGGSDPHTWTSPAYLGMQAITVYEALVEVAPEKEEQLKANLEKVLGKISEADKKIAANLKPHKGKAFYVFHPAFSYFAKQYGLTELAIEVEGKQPTPKQLLKIIEEAGASNAKAIFIEPQFDTSAAKQVAKEIGAEIKLVDPLQEDILTTLLEFSNGLAETLAE